MLPVTCDVNDPISKNPDEFTNPATNAKYAAKTVFLRVLRVGPSCRNTLGS
jgi:hypothetical protein